MGDCPFVVDTVLSSSYVEAEGVRRPQRTSACCQMLASGEGKMMKAAISRIDGGMKIL